MRWDYLVRFRDRYTPGGFRRLLSRGFSCDNVQIDYSPSVTACGHTAVYTGSIPAITGIVGNDWYDRYHHKKIYCTEDSTGRMSPANLLTTTLGDEMNLADNFSSKVVGIALKDRAAILPAGHTATAAFWFDGNSAGFVTSSWYLQTLPPWVQKFNSSGNMQKYYQKDWNTLYPPATYTRSTVDDEPWETVSPGEQKPVFPHKNAIRTTPFGDDLTLDFAKAAIEGYGLGLGPSTDLLAISLSSPDAIGHQYGPNSMEIEDTYLRLDREISAFLTWLDTRFGEGNYLLFLTADHGVTPSPGYAREHRIPGGAWDPAGMLAALNDSLAARFQVTGGIEAVTEFQLYLNREKFEQKGIALVDAEEYLAGLATSFPGIAAILPQQSLASASLPQPLKDKLINGYNRRRGGDMVILPEPGWKAGSPKGADHGLVYPDDTHIPLLFIGWKIRAGKTDRRINMTDIAPTLAALLDLQMPSGCIGQPIREITRN
jgi:predicted AlkP superfamily pyrophosphatase or phosphodiesterase